MKAFLRRNGISLGKQFKEIVPTVITGLKKRLKMFWDVDLKSKRQVGDLK